MYLCIVFFFYQNQGEYTSCILSHLVLKEQYDLFFLKINIYSQVWWYVLKSQPLKGWGRRVSSLKSTSNYMATSYLKKWWKYWGRAVKLEIVDFACTSHAQTENFFPWPRSGLAQPILLSAYQSLRPVRLISIHSETEKQSKPRGQRLICLVLSRRK